MVSCQWSIVERQGEKQNPGSVGPGVHECACCASKEARDPRVIRYLFAELPEQLRVTAGNRTLRKLLTAAHTNSQNRSRITSISVGRLRRFVRWPVSLRHAQPSRGVNFQGDCRLAVGGDSRRHWEGRLSSVPVLSRRRALSPGNAFPGTVARFFSSRSASEESGATPEGYTLRVVPSDVTWRIVR